MQIISLILKLFQTLPAKIPRLKYSAILPLALCFVTVYSKSFLKRFLLSDIKHSRACKIITYFQDARQQSFSCCFTLNKKPECSQSVTCNYEYSKELTLLYAVKLVYNKPPETIRNHLQPTEIIQNHPETKQNYLHQPNSPDIPLSSEPPNLTLLFCC